MNLTRNKIFSGILIFWLITSILVLLDIQFFYFRAIFSFIFLITIPGLLIMLMLKIRKIGFWEYLVYIIGLSITFLMFGGLFINGTLPLIGINKPLSLIPLIISLDIFLIIFWLIAYNRNKEISFDIKLQELDGLNRIFLIIPIIFPVLSIFGAIILNNHGPNYLTMLLLGGIAAYVFSIVSFRKKLNQNIYPWAILMMSISLLLMGWLRSWYVSGVDINIEYHIFQLVKANQQWNMSLFPNAYNTCLSVSLLPTILSSFLKINDQYIFKLIIPLIFSITPIGVYLFLKRYTQSIFAFMASFFFISQPIFITWWGIPIRQEISFLFFTLSLLILFNENLNSLLKKTFFLIFGFSIVVTHYSTAYVAVSLFIFTYLACLVFRKTESKKPFSKIYEKLNLKEKEKLNSKVSYLSGKIVLLLIVFTLLWNGQFTETSRSFIDFSVKTIQNMGKIFSEDVRTEGASFSSQWNIFYKPKDLTLFLQNYIKEVTLEYKNKPNINLYPQKKYDSYKPRVIFSELLPLKISQGAASKIYLFGEIIKKLVKIFIIFGVFYLIFTQLKKRKIDTEYIIIALVSLLWVLAVIVLPFASIDYDLTRVYQQVLIILSLPAVLGCFVIFKFFKKENLAIFAVLSVFLFYFLFISAFFPQIVGGPQDLSMQLNNFGRCNDEFYVYKSEIKSATWLFKESNNEDKIYVDDRAVNKFWLVTNINKNRIIKSVLPSTMDKKAYVYSSYTNTIKKRAFVTIKGGTIIYNFPTEFLNQNKNKIYNNGGSEVFK
jgi:uncharacterized membrane protein